MVFKFFVHNLDVGVVWAVLRKRFAARAGVSSFLTKMLQPFMCSQGCFTDRLKQTPRLITQMLFSLTHIQMFFHLKLVNVFKLFVVMRTIPTLTCSTILNLKKPLYSHLSHAKFLNFLWTRLMCFSRLCLLATNKPHSGQISFESSSCIFTWFFSCLVVVQIFEQLWTGHGIWEGDAACTTAIWFLSAATPFQALLQRLHAYLHFASSTWTLSLWR